MPQLNGPEQAKLVTLLVSHVGSLQSLDNAMNHSGNGHVTDFAANVPLPIAVSMIVDAFTRQFRIIELVQGILNDPNGLNGRCPPLNSWLNEMTPLLEERKLQQCETVGAFGHSPRRPWRDVPPSEAVILFPSVPNVREPIPLELLRRFAEQINSRDSYQLFNEANRIRTEMDIGDERRKTVARGRLPDPSAGLEYFLGEVFHQARMHGPRTYAAFLLIFGNECTEDVRSRCDSVLEMLVNYT